jgi:predicted type IV restriction endonuclease
MDSKPFLIFDMLDIKELLVDELKKFTNQAFDVDQIISTASELKYMNAIKKIIVSQLAQPTDDFVRFFASQVYSGHLRQNVLEQFTEITKRAWKEVITDRMKETFTKAAEDATSRKPEEQTTETVEIAPDKKIITTEEELDAFRIVRAIVREIVDVKRVVLRDAQSYCSVILDDNNRKPICRLHFNGSTKYVGLFDEQRNEERMTIESLDDMYKFADKMKATVNGYIKGKESVE